MKKRLYGILMALLLIAAPLFPLGSLPALAEGEPTGTDLTDTIQFVTHLEILGINGQPFEPDNPPENLAKNSSVRFRYTYQIPNGASIAAGDYYVIQLPEQFVIAQGSTFELRAGNETVATAALSADGKMTMVFTQYAATHSNVGGTLELTLYLDPDKVGTVNPDSLEFDLGGSCNPVVIDLNFDQPDPTITKGNGSYNAATGEIEWTVVLNKENVQVSGAVFSDNLEQYGMEYVPGSMTVNGSSVTPSYEGGVLSYPFMSGETAQITTKQTVKFRTRATNATIQAALQTGTQVNLENYAKLTGDEVDLTSNKATASYNISLIEKDGSFDAATKKISWKITVNKAALDIPDAVVTDTLPGGLIPDADSVKIDGVAPSAGEYSFSNPVMTFNLGHITASKEITFTTTVPEAYFGSNDDPSLNNVAALTGTGIPADTTDFKKVDIGNNVIQKSGTSYDAVTGQITWTVIVNKSLYPIVNAVVTDDIPLGLEYVPGSFTVGGTPVADNTNGLTYTAADSNDTEKTGSLRYSFGDLSTQKTITFKTQITDPAVYMSNVTEENYQNTATVSGDNITSSSSTGSIEITSNVLDKSGNGYDYIDRVITWKIEVNNNAMELKNVTVTDDIPLGLEYVPGSFTVGGTPVADNTSGLTYTAADSNDTEKTGSLSYSFSGTVTALETITFQTKITNLDLFKTNGQKTLKNTAKLTHQDLPGGITNEGSQKITNNVVTKGGSYQNGKRYIDWTVDINQNQLPLSSTAVLEDTLPEGLRLDTSSVALHKLTLGSNGALTVGDPVTLGAGSVVYNNETRKFTFTLTNPGSDAYRLTFTTFVTDQSKSPFTNTISFNGTGSTQNKTSSAFAVSFIESSSEGWGETGSITLHKVDVENTDKKLPGATFELIDRFGNVVDTQTTGPDGTATFNGLRFDVDYTVKETGAPIGYLINVAPQDRYNFQIPGSAEDKNVEYTFTNQVMRGNISFTKLDEGNAPLPGATFALYAPSDSAFSSPLATAQSNDQGVVTFENVPYGDYTIRETIAPEGYVLSGQVLAASITEDGQHVTATPGTTANTRIRGDITFTKLDEDNAPLPGATFALYSPSDSEFSSPLATAQSNDQGIVTFENVLYGDYTIRETIAPEGYALSGQVLTASVTENGVAASATPNTVVNERIRSAITFAKLGQVPFAGDSEAARPLAGAAFALYDASDSDFSSPLATAHSNDQGVVTFENVPYGSYTIKETLAPTGYLPSDQVLTATVTENGAMVTAAPDTIVNTLIRGDITFTKLGEVPAFGGHIDDPQPLAGAVFTLYAASDSEFSNPLMTAQSNDEGLVTFEGVPYGAYAVKETAAEGYLLSDEVLEASITEDGATVTAAPNTIINTLIRGNITFTKLDENGSPLPGAVFTLYSESDTARATPLMTAQSDSNGAVIFANVPYDRYVLCETTAPEGYVQSDEVLVAAVMEDGSTVTALPASIANRKIRGSVMLTKVNVQGDGLPGAVFGLYLSSDTQLANPVARATSAADGTVRFDDVPYGSYLIGEITAPWGYYLSEATVTAAIGTDGQVVDCGDYRNEAMPKKDYIFGSVEITKTNTDGQTLPGAVFALLNDQGVEVTRGTSDNQGTVRFENIPYGSYSVRELEAPARYVKALQDTPVKIQEHGAVVSVTIVNEKNSSWAVTTTPQTGDTSGLTLWWILLGGSLLTAAVLLWHKKMNAVR